MIENETYQVIDHKNYSNKKQFLIFVKIDPVINLEVETTTNKTDQETILNHHIHINLNFQTHKIKTLEAVYQNIKDKFVRYNLQMKHTQTLQVSKKQKLQSYS